MNWIASFARIIGTANPLTAMAVQFGAELDGRSIQNRLRRLEDPISSLHPDVGDVSGEIYDLVSETGESRVVFSDTQYDRYARVLAILEGAGMITGSHGLGKQFVAGFHLSDPSYVLYVAGLYEDPDLMERFVARVDSTPRNSWLRGSELAEEYALPLPVVRAFFQLLEVRGLGTLSRELGTANYYVRA